jgi:GTP-dependent phosphoenolpyruvate carboxykinase
VDETLWRTEAEGIRSFYDKFGNQLPKELADELSALEQRLHMHD